VIKSKDKVITGFDVYFDADYKVNVEKQKSFRKQFKRLVYYIFAKYKVVIPIDEFHDFCRDKFRKRMEEDIKFDKNKCRSFATYLYTILRNESTRVNKKYGRNSSYMDYFADKSKQEVSYKSNDDILDFFNLLGRLQVTGVNLVYLESNIKIRYLTPLVFAYYWLRGSGRI
jgi:hypothetical protein